MGRWRVSCMPGTAGTRKDDRITGKENSHWIDFRYRSTGLCIAPPTLPESDGALCPALLDCHGLVSLGVE